MALILNIDTAGENATVSLANEKEIIGFEQNSNPMNHAAFVQPAVEAVMAKSGMALQQIDAIAVSAGPVSYTGLRVGLASAKGLCFALDKSLILLNTLQIMAQEAKLQINEKDALFCPMIDARRMEVFAALFDFSLNEIEPTAAFILTEEKFASIISAQQKNIIYFGNGMPKWEPIASLQNALFVHDIPSNPMAMNLLAQESFLKKLFADVAYSEPLYSKSFFTTAKINNRL